jgi:uncharacterized protein
VEGDWVAHRDGLAELEARAWQPRTTLLGPFDPLIHDRERALALFGFRFKFEMYVPAAKREFGPYTLAVLHGERLIGRLDSAYDRRRGILVVRSLVEEPDAPAAARPAVQSAIRELAAWLGARDVEFPAT